MPSLVPNINKHELTPLIVPALMALAAWRDNGVFQLDTVKAAARATPLTHQIMKLGFPADELDIKVALGEIAKEDPTFRSIANFVGGYGNGEWWENYEWSLPPSYKTTE